ncbi:Transcription regulator (Contains diacylglycerol kinase catalytic domain) [Devosia sp. LC5]|uniref:lipid kinase n=1 Tax=Devosia sp. LC5 TaxID=1502724 RepID=UPI0004E3C175|nr:lipid kinase [Devosia sp. LC5]KFC61270.1 Transcription regulator (Contains diacylglycerol kinase catalytic domain) [Devosia sp. LC5]
MTAAMPSRRRGLMLVNPKSRRGGAALEPVIARLEAGGIDVVVERFETPEEVSADIARRRHEADLVIVCGGDGTINSAAKGVLATGLPMGILPMGTANDLARTLAIPDDLLKAADIIVAGHQRRIDLGEVNGHPFFNVASLGLSADLARGLTPEAKKRWGKLGYGLAAIRVLASARPFRAQIIGDDGAAVTVKTLQIAVGNGVHYGGGTVIHEDATIEDGHLDLYSLELKNVWKFGLMLGAFRRGQHGAWDEVRTSKSTEFDIRTREPREINTDGDIVTQTPAHFIIRPGAIAVFAP